MKLLNRQLIPALLLQLILVYIAGCGSPCYNMYQSEYSAKARPDTLSQGALNNLVTLTQPDTQHNDSKVYGDTIRAVIYGEKEGLLITGNFSNGCTHLKEVRYTQSKDTLNVHLEGWKPRDKVCTQALKPFQYVDTSQSTEWFTQFKAYKFPEH